MTDVCTSSGNPSRPPSPVYSATTRKPSKSNLTKRPVSVTSTAKSADRNSKPASTTFLLPSTSTRTGSMRAKRLQRTLPKTRLKMPSSAVMLQVAELQGEALPLGAGVEKTTRTKMPNMGMNDTFENISRQTRYWDELYSMAFTDQWHPVGLGTQPQDPKRRFGAREGVLQNTLMKVAHSMDTELSLSYFSGLRHQGLCLESFSNRPPRHERTRAMLL